MYFKLYSYSSETYNPPLEIISESEIDWHLDQLRYQYETPTFFDNFIIFEADLYPPDLYSNDISKEIEEAFCKNTGSHYKPLFLTIKSVLDKYLK